MAGFVILPGKVNNNIKTRQVKMNNPLLHKRSGLLLSGKGRTYLKKLRNLLPVKIV